MSLNENKEYKFKPAQEDSTWIFTGPVEYRTGLRKAQARVKLPAYRAGAILDEFAYSLDLLLHNIESQLTQLKEIGLLLVI